MFINKGDYEEKAFLQKRVNNVFLIAKPCNQIDSNVYLSLLSFPQTFIRKVGID